MKSFKIFFDTEFTGLHKDTNLISIGCVAEDGGTFYAEIYGYDESQVNDWIKTNVIDHLKFNEYASYLSSPKENHVELKGTKEYVAACFKIWLEDNYPGPIQMVSDVCHYDMVLFIDLFGDAFSLPKGINPACHDINQDIAKFFHCSEHEAFDYNREDIIKELPEGDKHNALYDAMVIKKIYEKLDESGYYLNKL